MLSRCAREKLLRAIRMLNERERDALKREFRAIFRRAQMQMITEGGSTNGKGNGAASRRNRRGRG